MSDYNKMHIAISNWMAANKDEEIKIKLGNLLRAISIALNINVEDIKRKNRRKDIVEARQLFYYFARSKFDVTLKTIADYLGQDHTTIVHGLTALQDKIDTNYNDINNTIKKLQWSYMMEN